MLVSPSSKIDRPVRATFDHIWGTCIHSVDMYFTMLWGMEGSLEISSQREENWLRFLVFTKALTLSQSAWNWFVTKCDRITRSTCHMHSKIWLCGYTIWSTAICAWLQSDMITEGQIAELTSFTQLTKKEMIFVVELELSIQAIGTPI